MKKNKGFSLIELIVVIAIMAVVMTGIGISIFSQSSWKCRQAKDITQNLIQQTRSESLGKTAGWMKICYENGECVIKTSFGSDQKLSNRVSVYYYWQNGTSSKADKTGPVEITDGTSLVLSFSRGTGGFQPMKKDVTVTKNPTKSTVVGVTDPEGNAIEKDTYSVTYIDADEGSNAYCCKLRIQEKNSGKGYTFTLHPVTGKIECEKD